MHDRWAADDSARALTDIDACARAANLLGAEDDLVLSGGGNVSVKADWVEFDSVRVPALFISPSGVDLVRVTSDGLVPLELGRLHRLLALSSLRDTTMQMELGLARLHDAERRPSVESLLHAVIPARCVLHTHADAILAVTNTETAEQLVREALGDDPAVVAYRMPGLTLARHVASTWIPPEEGSCGALVLLNHGLVTYGPDAAAAYSLHIELVSRAEEYLRKHAPRPAWSGVAAPPPDAVALAELRRRLSGVAGRPMIALRTDGNEVRRIFAIPGLLGALGRGPLTPDHVIRTKATALVGDDVEAFAADYRAYFERHQGRRGEPVTMLDPAPRVILHEPVGLITAGASASEAAAARDIFQHTVRAVEAAESLGGYRALEAGDLFDMEYWELEQAKLGPARAARLPLTGEVAFVTGAASGIGRACALELLAAGAAVVGVDVAAAVAAVSSDDAYVGVVADATSQAEVGRAVATAAERFGGLDMLVVSAGIFGQSQPVADLDLSQWHRTMGVNLDGLLRCAPGGVSAARTRPCWRPRRINRIEERAGARTRSGSLLGLQGSGDAAGASGGAGVGQGWDPRERGAPGCGVRHWAVDSGAPRGARGEVRANR